MSAGDQYWLYKWIDACGISSCDAAEARLSDPVSRQAMIDLAAAEPFTTAPLESSATVSITAGCGIDLSGNLDCFAWDCLKNRFDELLRHICLYFDRVVVVGASAHDFVEHFAELSPKRFSERVLPYLKLLLYLRAIGAEPLLAFRQKPPACQIHLSDAVEKARLGELLEIAEEESSYLEAEAEVSSAPHEGHLDYEFNHPLFEHTIWGAIPSTVASASLKRAVCVSVFNRYLAHLTADVRTARALRTPLGSSIRYHCRLLQGRKNSDTVAETAFAVGLPVLRGIDPATIIKLRSDEQPAFERFRRALRLALTERLKSTKESRVDLIAAQIHSDLIVPAIHDVEARLNFARRALARKAALSLSIGAISTACGLLVNEPILSAAGLAGAVGALTAEHRYVDQVAEIELMDMYFIWKVAGQHRHYPADASQPVSV
jgi:hypothetical protein